jgi:hypothetical protein
MHARTGEGTFMSKSKQIAPSPGSDFVHAALTQRERACRDLDASNYKNRE